VNPNRTMAREDGLGTDKMLYKHFKFL